MLCLREGTWLCSSCRRHVTTPVLACIGCNTPTARGTTCPACKPTTSLTGVVSAGPYAHTVFQRGIRWLKFKGVRTIADDVASLVIPHLPLIGPIEYLTAKATLVPIPLHKTRLQERGFNQSEDIVNSIHRYTNIPVSDVLVRRKQTWTQSQLPRDMRTKNTANAFATSTHIPHSIVILVDDVTTSGSTLTAAAHALTPHISPVSQIWALTVARG